MSRQGKQQEEQEENFYDCQETLEPSGRREEEEDFHIKTDGLTDRRDDTEREVGGVRKEEEQGDRLQEEEQGDRLQEEEQGDRLQEEEQGDRLQEEEQGDRLQEEEQGDRLQEEEQGDRLQEEEQEDFDDDYLKEAEKELTEEEKEVTLL